MCASQALELVGEGTSSQRLALPTFSDGAEQWVISARRCGSLPIQKNALFGHRG